MAFLTQQKLDMISQDARRLRREQVAAEEKAYIASETERNFQLFLNKARIAAEDGCKGVRLLIRDSDVRGRVLEKLQASGYRVEADIQDLQMIFLPDSLNIGSRHL